MINFTPRYCGPLGHSDMNHSYVEDKTSGGFYVLGQQSFLLHMPIWYGDDENNEQLLMSLVADAIDWMNILRTDKNTAQWPPHTTENKADPKITLDFASGTYERGSELQLVQDEISSATVCATRSHLTISMPIVSEDNLYFVNERRLMRLTTEALESLNAHRQQMEIDERKSEPLEINPAEAAD